ncbi:MAG: hypothetical protein ACOYOE_00285 [Chlorobium sp.]
MRLRFPARLRRKFGQPSSSVIEVNLTSIVRVVLSRDFLEHAGIAKDVIIIGADTKMIKRDQAPLLALLQQSVGRFASFAGRYC